MPGPASARSPSLIGARLRLLAPAWAGVAVAVALAVVAHAGWGTPVAHATPSAQPASQPPTQSMRLDIRGAAAHVTVTRTLPCERPRHLFRPQVTSNSDAIIDLALPERSALLDVEIHDGGRFVPTKALAMSKARDAYVESVRAMGITAADMPVEDEVRFRVRLACRSAKPNDTRILRYTFSTLLEFTGEQARVFFPSAPEASPPPIHVEVRLSPAGYAGEISIAGASHHLKVGGPAVATETVSTRGRWLVSVVPGRLPVERGDHFRLTALTSVATRDSGPPLLAYAIGASPGPAGPLPERVLFLVDRSRSVGPGGLEAERNLARRILEELPPSTKFDALFFDRGQKRLFPVARTATRAAISALEDEMVTSRLGNGTDLVAALRAAGELIRREASDFGPKALLIILSDGAIGNPTIPGGGFADLLGPLAGVDLLTAVISVRPNDDPAVSPAERRVLRELAAAAPLGGIERSLRTAEIGEAVTAILKTLRAGGDVHGIEIGSKTPRSKTPSGRIDSVAEVITAGAGASGIATTSSAAPLALRYQGRRQASALRPVKVDARWLTPLWNAAAPEARLLVGPAVAALVEPVPATIRAPASEPFGPSGYMERSVVRDALSIAFTPRARACYLNRSARTPADRDLSGRVRLALDLVRGEVAGVRVEASTLSHAIIEKCLRDAAYDLEVPRAYRNDDPVTAVLNLVFRPRNPERRPTPPENGGVTSEIDLMIEAALKQSGGGLDPTATTPDGGVASPDAGTPPDRSPHR